MKNSISNYFINLYGINKTLSKRLCFIIGTSPIKNEKSIADFKKTMALNYLQSLKYLTGFELKNKELSAISSSLAINNTKAYKLRAKLPLRGQRNKTNGSTARKKALQTLSKLKK